MKVVTTGKGVMEAVNILSQSLIALGHYERNGSKTWKKYVKKNEVLPLIQTFTICIFYKFKIRSKRNDVN